MNKLLFKIFFGVCIMFPIFVFAENLSGGTYSLQGASVSNISGTINGGGYIFQSDILTISGELQGGNYTLSTGYSAAGSPNDTPSSGGGGGGGGSYTGCTITATPEYPSGIKLTFSSAFSKRVFIFQGREYLESDSVLIYPTQTTTYSAQIKNSMYTCSVTVMASGNTPYPQLTSPYTTSQTYCVHKKGYYTIGKTGDDVSRIQRFLVSQGFTTPVTGRYSYATAIAVSRFQQKYYNEILASQGIRRPTGIWATGTDKKAVELGFCNGVLSVQEPVRAQVAESSVACVPIPGMYKIGSNGTVVQKIQEFLNQQGIETRVTGKYDYETALAVSLFQEQHFDYIIASQGFKKVTGIWGKMSSAKARDLGLCTEVATPVTRPNVPISAAVPVASSSSSVRRACYTNRIDAGTINSDQVRVIQKFLINQGYTNVRVTGNYVADTIIAVRAFQEKYADEILKPLGFTSPTGIWARSTAAKASQLGLCNIVLQ